LNGRPIIINILGNSLAIPSPKQGLFYRDTYAYRISAELGIKNIVVNRANRNMTVVDQTCDINIEDDLDHIQADYHVIHLGIVDCAPRLFTRGEQRLLGVMPFRRIIIRFASKHRYFLTKTFPKVYVRKDVFARKYRDLLEAILQKTPTKKIFLINLAATKPRNIGRSYGIEHNIRDYNAVIAEIAGEIPDRVRLIDLFAMTQADPSLVFDDGIHLTAKGHEVLAEMISHFIMDNEAKRGDSDGLSD